MNVEFNELRKIVLRQNNVLSSLAQELRHASGQNQSVLSIIRKQILGTFLAMLVLLVLAGFLLQRYQTRAYRSKIGVLTGELARLKSTVTVNAEANTGRKETEDIARLAYEKIVQGQHDRALVMISEIDKKHLSGMERSYFDNWESRTRKQQAQQAFKEGMTAFDDAQWNDAVASFSYSVKMQPNADYSDARAYHLGLCQKKLGAFSLALSAFEEARDLGAEKKINNQLYFQLGDTLELLGRNKDAVAAYTTYLDHFPKGSHAKKARECKERLSKKQL